MTDQVTRWIGQHAHPLTTLDPAAPPTDLLPLADLVGDAAVVALGASTRQSHELSALAHRIVRLLVEERGFRSLALEGDDATRVGLDAYVSTGTGDPRALLAGARSFWRTAEILDLVHWMRAFNLRRPDDPVRFAASTVTGPVPALDGMAGIEWTLAEAAIQWHERTGDKVVYWGGLVHTAAGTATSPTDHRNAGSYLRERFGTGYASLGLTFHHGTLPVAVPHPPTEYAEAVLGSAGPDAYLLDLRTGAPPAVRTWLTAPTSTRMIGPGYDPTEDADHHVTGGALTDWFDAVLHVRTVTPTGPLSPDEPAGPTA
ncbi:erythromycin esterase family protein [Streptomyces sp. NPDC059816]|uniref:erythromycin esterase family protein n=1 Tax=Streptomyces sp. NPDC059816 TaxID=3346960 RepID=UPI0036592156